MSTESTYKKIKLYSRYFHLTLYHLLKFNFRQALDDAIGAELLSAVGVDDDGEAPCIL
jgi:hypothetical protein